MPAFGSSCPRSAGLGRLLGYGCAVWEDVAGRPAALPRGALSFESAVLCNPCSWQGFELPEGLRNATLAALDEQLAAAAAAELLQGDPEAEADGGAAQRWPACADADLITDLEGCRLVRACVAGAQMRGCCWWCAGADLTPLLLPACPGPPAGGAGGRRAVGAAPEPHLLLRLR